jgi:hypothetical protein
VTDEPLSVSLRSVWEWECRHDPRRILGIRWGDLLEAIGSNLVAAVKEFTESVDRANAAVDAFRQAWNTK